MNQQLFMMVLPMNTKGDAVVEFYTELSDETAGWVADAASRFNVTRSEIIQRALEHYLRHVDEIRGAVVQRQQTGAKPVDWERARKTLRKANCPYDSCPFEDDCPGDVCPL